jgi:predicted  nucleic acid-binding Zn-ribbon protein
MSKVLKSTENAATKGEYEDLNNKLSEGKVETEKLEYKLANLEKQVSEEKKGQLEAEKEHADLKKKFNILETIMKEQKEVKCFSYCLFPLKIPVHVLHSAMVLR